MLAIFLGVCAYGAFQVKDGLNVAEMIPRENVEYAFVTARFRYFSFYQMHAVTMAKFDYANNQQLLHDYHRSFLKVEFFIILSILFFLFFLFFYLFLQCPNPRNNTQNAPFSLKNLQQYFNGVGMKD